MEGWKINTELTTGTSDHNVSSSFTDEGLMADSSPLSRRGLTRLHGLGEQRRFRLIFHSEQYTVTLW